MNKIIQILRYFICILGIYLFAFNPIFTPIGGMGLLKLLYPILLLFLIGSDAYKYNFKLLFPVTKIYILVVIFSAFLSTIYSTNIVYTRLINLIEIFLLPICLSTIFIRYNIKLNIVIFIVAAIASLISLASYINPTILLLIRAVQPVFDRADDWTLAMREYGFSSELYSGYGWCLGFIVVYYLKYLKEYKFYIVFLPIIAFSILINSRSGFLLLMIGMLMYAIFSKKPSSVWGVSFIVIGFVFLVSHINLDWINGSTMRFISDFFEQIRNMVTGHSEETYISEYRENHIILPDNIGQWMIGRGFSLMGNEYGVPSSDIGYLNDLAVGGLIYIYAVYKCFYKMAKLIHERWLWFSILAILIIINIKGQCLETNGLSRIIALVCFYEYLTSKYKKIYE